ncbi:MAG TPA: LysM peptidoglycan-binding domain-containing protein [Cytophagaceae bacterium]|jgi:nucleoid-associated protein YgaU
MGLSDFFKKGEEKPVAKPATPTPTPAPQVSNAPISPQQEIYEVKKGDSLSKVALQYYGDMKQWPKIFEANKNQISDPNKIKVGLKLIIPK